MNDLEVKLYEILESAAVEVAMIEYRNNTKLVTQSNTSQKN